MIDVLILMGEEKKRQLREAQAKAQQKRRLVEDDYPSLILPPLNDGTIWEGPERPKPDFILKDDLQW